MTEEVSTSETSVNLYQITRRNVTEDTCTCRSENLKSNQLTQEGAWEICGSRRGKDVCLCCLQKCWYLPATPHGVTTQMTNIDIVIKLVKY
jgi:hypothetical protein